MKIVIAAIISTVVGLGAHASDVWLVDDFTAVYRAKVGIAKGETKLQLRRTGDNQFTVESWTELKGLLSLIKPGEIYEYGEFEFVDGEIQPTRFTRSDNVSREDRNVEVRYDWSSNTAQVDHQGQQRTVAIEPGVSNTLVMQVALMQALSSQQQPAWLDVVGHKGRLRFDVSYEGPDTLTVDNKTRSLYRYSHSRVDSGIRTTFWAAPDRAHLPLRARIVKGDKVKGMLNLSQNVTATAQAAD
ncbi:MAG: DUF3108 domain-containing protein [Gammaproteobacteria bacterium]